MRWCSFPTDFFSFFLRQSQFGAHRSLSCTHLSHQCSRGELLSPVLCRGDPRGPKLPRSCKPSLCGILDPGVWFRKLSAPATPAPARPAGLQRPAPRLSGTGCSFRFRPRRGPQGAEGALPGVTHRQQPPTLLHIPVEAGVRGGRALNPGPSARCPPVSPRPHNPSSGATSPLAPALSTHLRLGNGPKRGDEDPTGFR